MSIQPIPLNLESEARYVFVEALSALAWYKRQMIDYVAKPSGIPSSVYEPAFRNGGTKKIIAQGILDGLERHRDQRVILRRLIDVVADWSLIDRVECEKERAAQIVQVARDLRAKILQAESGVCAAGPIAQHDKSEERRVSLLVTFEELYGMQDRQRRGYLLQDLLNETFSLHGIDAFSPFVRNANGEQIDGAFRLEGWHYLGECRWQTKLTDTAQVDAFRGKVERSGEQTMGLLLSIEGWSQHVIPLLKQNREKRVFLMDGYDLRIVLDGQLSLGDLIRAKLVGLNHRTEPFISARQCLATDG